ncbi:MAG: hypothetical protein KBT02_00160 [Treponema sp.]|nr:hypothetical protein [Candidatus Treponema caballi]
MKTFTGNIATALSKCLEDAEKKCTKACINTVNIQAGMTRKEGMQNMERDFILRNKFTQNSVRFTQCPKSETRLSRIQATAGVTEKASYMERQEKGGIHTNPSGKELPIPTDYARGGTKNKQVRSAYRLNKINRDVVKGPFAKHGSKKSETVARAFVAKRENKLVRFGRQNLFKVTSFRANGSNPSFKMKEVYTFRYIQTRTPQKPWLEPAAEHAKSQGQNIFNQQMDLL